MADRPSPEEALRLAKAVADLYSAGTAELVQIVARQSVRGSAANARGKLAELVRLRGAAQKLVAQVQAAGPAKAIRLVADAYGAGVARGSAGQAGPVTTSLVRTNESAVHYYARQLAGELDPLGPAMLRWADDAYRQVIADTAHLVVTGSLTQTQATARAVDRFAQLGVTTFVGRDGSRMRIESYAEMATRTTVQRAYLGGAIDAQLRSGRPLAIVAGGTGCPQCFPWVNQVISLDGSSPNFPSLAEALTSGLFHPNCTHSIDPYREGGLIVPPPPPTAAQVAANAEHARVLDRARALERAVRESHRRVAAAKVTGDPRLLATQRHLLAVRQARLKEHVSRHGLKPYVSARRSAA
ncbi:MAG TPA: phage minor capsid protein [Spirillospora sp.]|nr:phage minor capsid protein [Spirillospora sp.]